MYNDKKIAVVIPCYNEEKLISKTILGIPDYVDTVIIVNDCSTDSTSDEISKVISKKSELDYNIINNSKNLGLGRSISIGYKCALSKAADIAVIMAGDNQMDPVYLPNLLDPLVESRADYTKGNRLTHKEFYKMPRFRRFGNSILSLLTKISTGYWNIIDPQNGYTAASSDSLEIITSSKIANGYGYNSDILTSLNIENKKVLDISIPPVYADEKSGIKIGRYTLFTSWILLSGFFRRIHSKYGGLRLHPILFYYYFSFFFLITSFCLIYRMFYIRFNIQDTLPTSTTLGALFSFVTGIQFLLSAFSADNDSI